MTPDHFVVLSYGEELAPAMKQAVREMVDFLVSEKGLKPYDAYTLCSLAGDVRVSRTFRPISPVKDDAVAPGPGSAIGDCSKALVFAGSAYRLAGRGSPRGCPVFIARTGQKRNDSPSLLPHANRRISLFLKESKAGMWLPNVEG